MTLPVAVHAEAAAELEAAALWYDDQRDGLGLQFLAAVDRTIQHARAWPHTGVPIEGLSADLTVRRLAVARFSVPLGISGPWRRDPRPGRRT